MESNNICKFNMNRSSDLICTDLVYETENALVSVRRLSCFMLGIVTKGTAVLKADIYEHKIETGNIFIALKGSSVSVDSKNGGEYAYLSFSGRRAEELVERIGASSEVCVYSGTSGLTELWTDTLKSTDNTNLDLFSEAILLYTLAQIMPRKKTEDDLINRIVSITNEHYSNASFSLSGLADKLGYDAKYLSAYFKKKKGICFSEYLRDLRIKHAVFLIEQGVVSVKNIAILSGFSDALYFSKIFKKSEGLSPKEYIQKATRE